MKKKKYYTQINCSNTKEELAKLKSTAILQQISYAQFITQILSNAAKKCP